MKKIRPLMQPLSVGSLVFVLAYALIITPMNARAESDSAQADFTPWSGWWWPSSMGGLATGLDYNGHPAPLEKYDLLTGGSYPGKATRYYLDTEYDPDAISWRGLCHAYAAAAVYEPIAFYPSSYDNIIFQVGDKKGLITACHQHDQLHYGTTHDPADFHFWLLNTIKDQGRSFYAELDPSEEVWNFPVFRYEMDVTRNGSILNVRCTIGYASDFVHPDFQGTDEKTKTYTYTLILSGEDIVGGEWTGASVYDHPQQIVIPLDLGDHNPYLDYSLVRDIAVSRDDPHESEEPSELLPGGYNQILADRDSYTLSTQVGEQIHLAVENMDTLAEGIQVSVLDKDSHLIQSAVVNESERAEFSVSVENPPYTLVIARQDYSETGYYRLECDLRRVYTFYNPNVQKGYGWGGFAISNNSDAAIDAVYVTGYDKQGRPLETYVGPFNMLPGEKRIVQVSDFKVRTIDRNALYGVKIHATQPINVVSLSGYYNTNMSAAETTAKGHTFVVPDVLAGFSLTESRGWGLSNQSGTEARVTLTHFSGVGAFMGDALLTLSPQEATHYNAGSQPVDRISNGGWVKIEAESGTEIGGYTQWLAKNLKYSERLPLLSPATRFIIPHVYTTSDWGMDLILINTEAASNSISIKLLDGKTIVDKQLTLAPHEKRIIAIGDLFADVPVATLIQSGVSIDATRPLAGYYTFETGNDHLYFSLLDVNRAELSLTIPHVASDGYWWTCVNLFNPSDTQPARLSLIPHDGQGKEISAAIKEIELSPSKKNVFSLYGMWGGTADRISFVNIRVDQGPPMVGLYAYGNMDNSMVAGIPFKKLGD